MTGLTPDLYPNRIEPYPGDAASRSVSLPFRGSRSIAKFGGDLLLQLVELKPRIPMLSNLSHSVAPRAHICTVGPFVHHPIWLVLEQRWCYPRLVEVSRGHRVSASWLCYYHTSKTNLNQSISIQFTWYDAEQEGLDRLTIHLCSHLAWVPIPM